MRTVMDIRSKCRLGLFLFAFGFSPYARSACLDEVAKFAEQICGEISKSGSNSVVKGSGELNVKAEGLLKKFLASAGLEVNFEGAKQSYENVLREDLKSELQNNRACRIKMVEVGQKYCRGDLSKPELEHIKWPAGRKRYYIEASNIRPSCIEDVEKTNHELKIAIAHGKVDLELDGMALEGRLIDDGKTILVSGNVPSEGGYTSFSNAELRLRNDKMIEAEMEWIWRNSNGDVCTGALLISNTIEQRRK